MIDVGREAGRSRPGRAARRSRPRWSATPSPCTTGASSSRCSSPRTWSVTSSASSRRRARSTATPATARPRSRPAVARAGRARGGAEGQVGMEARAISRFSRITAAEGPPGRRPDPRQAGRGGARHPRVHAEARGAAWSPRRCKSAVANAENTQRVDVDALYVKRICVDEGPTAKRFLPRAHGRATPVFKRTQPHHRRRRRAPQRRGGLSVGQKVHPKGFRLGVIENWDSQLVRAPRVLATCCTRTSSSASS